MSGCSGKGTTVVVGWFVDAHPVMGKTRQRSGGMSTCMKVLHVINRTDKWLVSGTVFFLVTRYFGVSAVWTLLGSLVNAVVCKIAKRAINQPRPGSALKTDPGMPSSHACSISYLSLYAAMLLRSSGGFIKFGIFGLEGATVAAVAVVSIGVFLTSLRLACGDHTWQQVRVFLSCCGMNTESILGRGL